MVNTGKQIVNQYDKILGNYRYGGVSELADEHDLGSCAVKAWGFESPLPHFYVQNIKIQAHDSYELAKLG